MLANKSVTATFVASTPMWQGNGTKVFYNTNNVGIGTMNPSEKLEVSGNVKAAKFIGDGTGLTNIGLWTLSGANIYYNSGNVGIRKTPTVPLDVNGAINSTSLTTTGTVTVGSTLTAGNIGIGTSTPYGKLNVANGALNVTTSDFVSGTTGTVISTNLGTTTGNTYGTIQVGTNGNNGTYGNLVLNPNGGNVGIGTDPGTVPFKIFKSSIPCFELADASTRLNVYVYNDQVVYRALGTKHQLVFHMSDDNNDGNSFIQFSDDANGAWYKIFNNRTVRIDGVVYAKELNVITPVFPDYVFKPGYKLKTLAEIEAYIKAHGHLEEVPDESCVKEKGINVAELNTLLLKKIEEMTLLMIEQNKRIEALEKENAVVKAAK